VLPVLFESKVNGYWEGHTTQYMTVRAKENGKALGNQIIPVRLTELKKEALYGIIEEEFKV
jgi:hypothetical protein